MMSQANVGAKIHIILTMDYEIFGDGTGDVRHTLVEPTDSILRISEQFHAPMTIFFEICEYWAFERERKKLSSRFGYDPAALMMEQIRGAMDIGHDVQLHAHPQWLDCAYEHGSWRLNNELWKLSSLPLGSAEDPKSITGVLTMGRRSLEQMLKGVRDDYRCIAFRSGALCIQPSADFYTAAVNSGIKIDSSVSKGLFIEDKLSCVDFRQAHHHWRSWYADPSDIIKKDTTGHSRLMEVPIASVLQPVILQINLGDVSLSVSEIIRGITQRKAQWKGTSDRMGRGTAFRESMLKRLIKPVYTGLDFCMASGGRLFRILKSIVDRSSSRLTPIVITGHPKVFKHPDQLELFMKLVQQNFIDTGLARFSTFPEFLTAHELENHDKSNSSER